MKGIGNRIVRQYGDGVLFTPYIFLSMTFLRSPVLFLLFSG